MTGEQRRTIMEQLAHIFDGCAEWTAADWANVAVFAAKHSELDDQGYMALVTGMAESPLVELDDETDMFCDSDLALEHRDHEDGYK